MTQPNPIRTRALARKRRPLWPALAVGAVLLVGAYAGATAVFSGRAQGVTQDFGRTLTRQIGTSGVATLQETGYRRGLTESTQTMLLTVADERRPLKVLVTNHIKHGPLPGFQGVGQAIIDTDFRFEDAQTQAEFDRLFPNEKPRIHTLVGLTGNTDSRIGVPQGQTVSDGQTVAWKALGGNVRVSGNRLSTDLSWPGLTFSGPDGRFNLDGVALRASTLQEKAGDALRSGTTNFAINNMSGVINGKTTVLGNMKFDYYVIPDGATYTVVSNNTLGTVEAEGSTLNDLRLNLRLTHLDRAALQRLSVLASELQQRRGRGSAPALSDLTDAQTSELQAAGLALLRGNPKLTLDRLSVRQPGGELLFKGEASAPGLAQASAEELQVMAAMPAAMLGLFRVHLEGSVSKQALQELADLGGAASGAAGLSQNIQALVSSGYVKENGDQLTTQLDLQEGQLKLNGQALGQ